MKLTRELFEDVIAYIFAEPGAMGAGGCIECLRLSGELFFFSYLDEESNWELVKENFEGINGCKFNGPHRNVAYSANLLCIGGSDDEIVTTIKEGWREVCFDVGNHFVCKAEYADAFVKSFDGMEGYEIICDGFRKIHNEKLIETLGVGENN